MQLNLKLQSLILGKIFQEDLHRKAFGLKKRSEALTGLNGYKEIKKDGYLHDVLLSASALGLVKDIEGLKDPHVKLIYVSADTQVSGIASTRNQEMFVNHYCSFIERFPILKAHLGVFNVLGTKLIADQLISEQLTDRVFIRSAELANLSEMGGSKYLNGIKAHYEKQARLIYFSEIELNANKPFVRFHIKNQTLYPIDPSTENYENYFILGIDLSN